MISQREEKVNAKMHSGLQAELEKGGNARREFSLQQAIIVQPANCT